MTTAINPHTRTEFSREFRKFMRSLVTQRAYLVEAGKSKKNQDEMQRIVTSFTAKLSLNFTDVGAAVVLTKYHSQLRRLIPAGKVATFRKLDEFLVQAYRIINPEIYMS